MCGSVHSAQRDSIAVRARALMREYIERKLASSDQKELKRIEYHGFAHGIVDTDATETIAGRYRADDVSGRRMRSEWSRTDDGGRPNRAGERRTRTDVRPQPRGASG